MDSWVSIIVLVMLLLLSGLFSSMETAYTCINNIRLKQRIKKGEKAAEKVLILYERIHTTITTILIANNIVNVVSAAIATKVLTTLFGNYGVLYASILMTILILIFGEITPKIFARLHWEFVTLKTVYFLQALVYLFYPISKLVDFVSMRYLKEHEDVTVTEDELLDIVSTIEQEGVLEREERELIESVIEFDDTMVRDIMIKKDDVVFLYDNATFEDISKVLKNSRYSRIPVISYETLKVVGILKSKDIFECLLEKKEVIISELMKEPIFVTQRKKLPQILESIQKSREHMAIVIESVKNPNYVGIVTLEDILEEIVGEIYDEYDELPKDVFEIGHHTYLINAKINVIDFFYEYLPEQPLPQTKAKDFSSWIYELNKERKVRKNRVLEFENLEIKVLETKEGKATKLEIEVHSFVE